MPAFDSRVEATAHPAEVLLGGEAQPVDVLAGGYQPHLEAALFDGDGLELD